MNRSEPDAFTLASPSGSAFLDVLRISTQTTTEADRLLRETGSGIRANEFDVIAMLFLLGPQRPSQLLTTCTLIGTATTLSSILRRLDKRGLTSRVAVDGGPGVIVSLTAAGAALFQGVFPAIYRHLIVSFAAHYSADEISTLAELLERLSTRRSLPQPAPLSPAPGS